MSDSPLLESEYTQADFGWQIPKVKPVEIRPPSKFKLLTLEKPPIDQGIEFVDQAERMGLIFSGLNVLRAIGQKNKDLVVNSAVINQILQQGLENSPIFKDATVLDGVTRTIAVLRGYESLQNPAIDGNTFMSRILQFRRCLDPSTQEQFAKQLEGLKEETVLKAGKPPVAIYKINQRTRQRLLDQSYQRVKSRLSQLTQEYVLPIQRAQGGINLFTYQDYNPVTLQDLYDDLSVPIHDLNTLVSSISLFVQLAQRQLGREDRTENEKKAWILERFAPFGQRFNLVYEFISTDTDNEVSESTKIKNEVGFSQMINQINEEAVPFFVSHDIDYMVDHLALDREIDPQTIVAKCSLSEFRRLSREISYNIRDAFLDKQAEAKEGEVLESPETIVVFWFDREKKELVIDFLANCRPYPEEFIGGNFKRGRSVRTVQTTDTTHSGLGMAYHKKALVELGGDLDAQNPQIRGQTCSQTRVRLPLLSFQYRLSI